MMVRYSLQTALRIFRMMLPLPARRESWAVRMTDDNAEDERADRDRKGDLQAVGEPLPSVGGDKGLIELIQQRAQSARQIIDPRRNRLKPLIHSKTVHSLSSFFFLIFL